MRALVWLCLLPEIYVLNLKTRLILRTFIIQSTFTVAFLPSLSGFMKDENGYVEAELPAELNRLVSLIDEKPEAFGSGDEDIQDAALAAAKYIFDLGEPFR